MTCWLTKRTASGLNNGKWNLNLIPMNKGSYFLVNLIQQVTIIFIAILQYKTCVAISGVIQCMPKEKNYELILHSLTNKWCCVNLFSFIVNGLLSDYFHLNLDFSSEKTITSDQHHDLKWCHFHQKPNF